MAEKEALCMYCSVNDLKSKFVVNVRNGGRLGSVSDVEIDTVSAMVSALLIRGRLRFFGLLGREEDTVIKWSEIEVIGEDTILVNCPLPPYEVGGTGKRGGGLFRILTED